jgi:hypothetical protein
LLDDAPLLLDLCLEVRPICAGVDRRVLFERPDVLVEGVSEPIEDVLLAALVLLERDRRDVDRDVVLAGEAWIEVASTEPVGQVADDVVDRSVVGLGGLGDVTALLDAGPGTQLLGPEAAEVELRGQRPDNVGVRLLERREKAAEVDGERIEPGVWELVGRARRDRSRLQADGVEAVDDLAGPVEDGDVAVAEQLGDDRRAVVVALEPELDDAVELELLDAGEFGARQAVAQHHREVRRALGGRRNPFRVGDPGV